MNIVKTPCIAPASVVHMLDRNSPQAIPVICREKHGTCWHIYHYLQGLEQDTKQKTPKSLNHLQNKSKKVEKLNNYV